MTSSEALAYAQELLNPPPEPVDPETWESLLAWADAGLEREAP